MDGKAFLHYLIQTHQLTPSQANLCAQECVTKKQGLPQILIQQGYFTSDTLKQCLFDFNQLKKTSSFSEVPENNILAQIETMSKGKTSPSPVLQPIPEDDLLEQIELLAQKKPMESTTENQTVLGILSLQHKTEPILPHKKTDSVPVVEEERYEVLKTLGEGGMGVVQLVKDNLLGREVALKKVKLQKSQIKDLSKQQKMMLWRLNKEAAITAILEHPNIIPLYEMQQHPLTLRQGSGQADSGSEGELCFTMRKVEGQTLRAILKQKQQGSETYDEEKLISIYSKVCDALAYAHSKGVIHRDLKPDNVMVGQFGEVYVMDWGIAKQLEKIDPNKVGKIENLLKKTLNGKETNPTQEKTIGGMGTPGYMAPEQAQDASQVKPQSDIYALGQLLKECFTYLSPMEELQKQIELDRLQHKISKRQKKSEETRKVLEEQVPEAILAIVKKATEKDWEERYTSVQELAEDLQKYYKNLKVSVKEYSLLEMGKMWAKRNKQSVIVFGVSLGILVLCVFAFWRYLSWKSIQEVQWNLAQARQREEEAKESKEDLGKEKLLKKIEKLLFAQNFINVALFVSPRNREAQEMKWRVGKQLVKTCYGTEDYNLAMFIANELKRLSFLGKKEKESLIVELEEKRDEKKKRHRERFEYWKNHYLSKERKSQGEVRINEREDALFEISKMQEQEIFEEMIGIVKESREYFKREEKEQEERKSEYYQVMIEALGRLENPEAGEELVEALERMESERSKEFEKERNKQDSGLKYMVVLAEALANSKAFEKAEKLDKIRWKMGQNKLFWVRTTTAFQKLSQGLVSHYDEAIRLNPQSASAYNNRGNAKYAKGELEGAIKDYTEAIRLNPQSASAYTNRGVTKKAKGELEGAIKDYTEAIRLNPQSASAYNNRGVTKKAKGELEGAIKDYTEAICLNPQSASAYNNRGDAKYAKEELEGAIKDYTEAIKLDPQYASAYTNRGNAKYAKGELEGAIKDYTEAIKLNPQSALAYTNRGDAKYAKGELEGAIKDYTEAIRLDPQSASAYTNRGVTKKAKGELEGAIKDYTEAIKLDPQSASAYNNRGLAKDAKGELEGAIKDYTEAIKLNPQSASAYNNRGACKFNTGDLDGAIADCTEAIRLNPQGSSAYNNRGSAKGNKGNFKGAIEDYTDAIRLNPRLSDAYSNRGGCKFNTGDLEGAIEDCTEAIRLNPENASAYNNRGEAKQAKGDFDETIEDCTKAIFLNPQLADAYNHRGFSQFNKGKREEAKSDLKKYLELTKNKKDPQTQQIRKQIFQIFPELSK
jgi:tetratricopeptide (TPR) repeat protein/serine/threonine protein kinase